MLTFNKKSSKNLATSAVTRVGGPPSPPSAVPNYLTKLIILGLLSVISSRAAPPFLSFGASFLPPLAFGSSTTASTGSSPSIWMRFQSLRNPVSFSFLSTTYGVASVDGGPGVNQSYLTLK